MISIKTEKPPTWMLSSDGGCFGRFYWLNGEPGSEFPWFGRWWWYKR